jgi:uncharacterized protein
MTRRRRGVCACVSLICTAISLLGLTSMAWGGIDEGLAAYDRSDYATAYREFLPLAQQGDAEAQLYLGMLYQEGNGIPQDYAEAAKWYRRAAEQGKVLAQWALAALYNDGHGVPQDYTEAANWYRKAADQGCFPCQFNLGLMYAKGQGVPQDYVLAHLWFNLAASHLPPGGPTKKTHEKAVQGRDLVAAKMTPAQIAEAQRLAREWKPKQP